MIFSLTLYGCFPQGFYLGTTGEALPAGYYRQDYMRRIFTAVVNGLPCSFQAIVLAQGSPGVGITVETREVAAGYFHSQAMARLQHMAGRPQVNVLLVDPAGVTKEGRRTEVR